MGFKFEPPTRSWDCHPDQKTTASKPSGPGDDESLADRASRRAPPSASPQSQPPRPRPPSPQPPRPTSPSPPVRRRRSWLGACSQLAFVPLVLLLAALLSPARTPPATRGLLVKEGIAVRSGGLRLARSTLRDIYDGVTDAELFPDSSNGAVFAELEGNLTRCVDSALDLNRHIALDLSFSIKVLVGDRGCEHIAHVLDAAELALEATQPILDHLDAAAALAARASASVANRRTEVRAESEDAMRQASNNVAYALVRLGRGPDPDPLVRAQENRRRWLDASGSSSQRLEGLQDSLAADRQYFVSLRESLSGLVGKSTGLSLRRETCKLLDVKSLESFFLHILTPGSVDGEASDHPRDFGVYYEWLCDGDKAYFCTSTAIERKQ